ncbi:MAG: hypothetical protein JSW59_14365, partial [Phycisphaerales bacterium]
VLAVLCLSSLPAPAQYGGGTGEPDDPYLICTAEQMNEIGANFRKDWDKHFKLMADIDMSAYIDRDYRIIGSNNNNAFRGVFDGNGKRIWNLSYTSTSRDYAGLFGYIRGPKAEIKNLELVNPNIHAGTGSYVGSLVGYNEGLVTNCCARSVTVSGRNRIGGLIGYTRDLTVTDCDVKGGSVSGEDDVGGLVGSNGVDISNCHASCRVSGNKSIGGLVGDNSGPITDSSARGRITAAEREAGGLVGDNSGPLTNCYARGDVRANRSAGGLVGSNSGSIMSCWASGDISGEQSIGGLVGSSSHETIDNCYARGTVTGEYDIGGLVGRNRRIIRNSYATGGITGENRVGGLVGGNTWPGKITNCYSIGVVIGTTDVGGLVGFNDEGVIKFSFWDVQTSGRNNMCGQERLGIGCDNAGGKTTAAMQRKSTFLDAGWEFASAGGNGTDGIWIICDGLSYPEFTRQFVIGDFDGDNRVDLSDFAFLAERWLSVDRRFFWCRGADITGDGKVGVDDLREFADNWLAEGVPNLTGTVYLIVDDFESYNDLDPADPESNRIFNAWLDGYFNPATNGAIVGHITRPFVERQIVHSGRQSMPYFYDALFKIAKAELMLDPPQNWAGRDAKYLSLWFLGDPSNAPVPMSVILNGRSTVYHNDPGATRIDTWMEWIIDLQTFTGVDLANVNSIAICFGHQSGTEPGGSGKVFFDDIRICGPG